MYVMTATQGNRPFMLLMAEKDHVLFNVEVDSFSNFDIFGDDILAYMCKTRTYKMDNVALHYWSTHYSCISFTLVIK